MTEGLVLAGAQGFAVLYGLVIGSFWNVAIGRLPEDRSLWPRSACPSCGAPVRAKDNVPVLAWFWLRGRCRDCQAPIAVSYPLIEALGGLLGWLLFRTLVPDLDHLDAAHLGAWVVYFGFFSLLIVGAYVDLRHRILPDQVTSYAVPFGLAGVALLSWLGFDGFPHTDLRGAFLGAAIYGGGSAFLATAGMLVYRQEVLGWGDVKLAAMLGAFLGPVHAFVAILWGSVIGSVVGILATVAARRRIFQAFGPPLALGAIGYVLYGEPFARLFLPQWNP